MKEAHFSLTYGTEAMLSLELAVGSPRKTYFEEANNDKNLRLSLDLIKERCEQSNIRQEAYKNVAERYYNQRVKEKAFNIGDYILRRNEASHAQPYGKLGPTWEGPYKVIGFHRNGSYTLKTMEWRQIPKTWNARKLRKFHF